MNLDDLIIAWFCLLDDLVPTINEGDRLRKPGPEPTLAVSLVITMEVIGMYLGLNQDKALFAYFRRHWTPFFPALAHLHRTTFVRQATNLWAVKERLWCAIRDHLLTYDPLVGSIDSFPLPACQFARAYRCRRFRGEASYGQDTLIRQTFYGFRLHARICWPGVITRIELVPANIHEGEVALGSLARHQGTAAGRPQLLAAQAQSPLASDGHYRAFAVSERQACPARLARVRCWGASAIALTRCLDNWWTAVRPSGSGRGIAGTCAIGSCAWSGSHTLAILFNLELSNPPLQLARLVA